jgi:hypothetical protein
MMRTIEIILVITILLGAFLTASYFAVLPSPRKVSSINLKKLAATTLQTLDSDSSLSETVFKPKTDPKWGQLQTALSSCLPPNIIYNLTVYDILGLNGELYSMNHSISNAESLGATSEATSYLAASSNVKLNITPERINKTLYILNCSDSNGWWITGYTPSTLAEDLYRLLNPYFQITIPVNTTAQLAQILNGTKISSSPEDQQKENITGAVIINTCGEAVPIPAGYYSSPDVGYDNVTGHNPYARYFHTLGNRTHQYNWTWASIVGYPFYYVSNTVTLSTSQNNFGIYGMSQVASAGVRAFLQGLNNLAYNYDTAGLVNTTSRTVQLTTDALNNCNYYGIYPFPNQTATRSLNNSIISTFNLTVPTYIFNNSDGTNAGAIYKQADTGALLAIGVTRTPDIRLTALGLLSHFRPRLYHAAHTVVDTSRLVVLQLGQVGGV